MLKIRQYVKAQSLEEAYTLCQKKGSVVLGGMLWLKMQNRPVGTAIDLCGLGLDTIEETDTEYRIGAMVPLRAIETHPGLNALTQGAFRDCLSPIIGVQFRNLATIGGSIWGRFGFSDPVTLFLALGAQVELFHRGVLSLEDFLNQPTQADILVRVILPKTPVQAVYLSQRNTATDFPTLTCALCKREGEYLCALGGRPSTAALYRDEKNILSGGITEESAAAFGEDLSKRAGFGTNLRGSAEYRQKISKVLVRRALLAMKEGE